MATTKRSGSSALPPLPEIAEGPQVKKWLSSISDKSKKTIDDVVNSKVKGFLVEILEGDNELLTYSFGGNASRVVPIDRLGLLESTSKEYGMLIGIHPNHFNASYVCRFVNNYIYVTGDAIILYTQAKGWQYCSGESPICNTSLETQGSKNYMSGLTRSQAATFETFSTVEGLIRYIKGLNAVPILVKPVVVHVNANDETIGFKSHFEPLGFKLTSRNARTLRGNPLAKSPQQQQLQPLTAQLLTSSSSAAASSSIPPPPRVPSRVKTPMIQQQLLQLPSVEHSAELISLREQLKQAMTQLSEKDIQISKITAEYYSEVERSTATIREKDAEISKIGDACKLATATSARDLKLANQRIGTLESNKAFLESKNKALIVQNTGYREKLEAHENEATARRSENEALNTRITVLSEQYLTCEAALTQQQLQYQILQKKVENSNAEVAKISSELEPAKNQVISLETLVKDQKDKIDKLEFELSGSQQGLKDELERTKNQLKITSKESNSRVAEIEDLRRSLETKNAATATLESKLAEIEQENNDLRIAASSCYADAIKAVSEDMEKRYTAREVEYKIAIADATDANTRLRLRNRELEDNIAREKQTYAELVASANTMLEAIKENPPEGVWDKGYLEIFNSGELTRRLKFVAEIFNEIVNKQKRDAGLKNELERVTKLYAALSTGEEGSVSSTLASLTTENSRLTEELRNAKIDLSRCNDVNEQLKSENSQEVAALALELESTKKQIADLNDKSKAAGSSVQSKVKGTSELAAAKENLRKCKSDNEQIRADQSNKIASLQLQLQKTTSDHQGEIARMRRAISELEATITTLKAQLETKATTRRPTPLRADIDSPLGTEFI